MNYNDLSILRHQWENKSKSWKKRIYERDGYKCKYCGSTNNLTIDHIIPLAKGGTNEPDNLRVMCRTCNCRKGRGYEQDYSI